jgi:hypothetical protein
MERPNVTKELERLIDATSLLDVLTGLSLVCSEKADHIRSNWQDAVTARPWRTASNRLEQIARKTEI